jgi:hypothetical protein
MPDVHGNAPDASWMTHQTDKAMGDTSAAGPATFEGRKAAFMDTDLYKNCSDADKKLVQDAKDDQELNQAMSTIQSHSDYKGPETNQPGPIDADQ